MSWKDYQMQKTGKARWIRRARFVFAAALLSVGFVFAAKFMIFSVRKVLTTVPSLGVAKTPSTTKILEDFPLGSLQEIPKEVKIYRKGLDWTLLFTFDPELQKFVYNKLKQYQVDWAGVSVIDAKTGAVRALVSYSSQNPDIENLSLRATFPAASIFKVVTAGAAVQEKHFDANTVFRYAGDARYVNERFLTLDQGKAFTLGDAFARSTNGVFAKVGSKLKKDLLFQYASAFGFNENLPFDFPVQPSTFEDCGDDLVEKGKMAAGLGDVTLSPLHAALIAGGIVNEGKMMRPYSLERILDDQHGVAYENLPTIWKQPVTSATSSQLRKMMRMTIVEGTARNGFRNFKRDSVLASLDIGGKTGSLTGKDPMGRNEWFMGYAQKGDESLALGIVIVSKQFWKIKPSELAKSVIRYHFKEIQESEGMDLSAHPKPFPEKAAL